MPEARPSNVRGRLRQVLPWLALAAVVVLADQATKLAVLDRFAPGESLRVTSFFDLVLVYNKGAAFSFLAKADGWQTPLLIAISVVAIGIVSVMLWRNPAHRLLDSGLAFILGGAAGNLIDRVAYGKVVDFLLFHAYGWSYPAFNVADSAITVGAAILIIESFMARAPEKGHA
jgi:signal peptidase II